MSATAPAERAAIWIARAWSERDEDDAALAVDALALGHLCRLLAPDAAAVVDELEEAVDRAIAQPAWPVANLMTALLAAAGAVREGSAFATSASEYLQLLGELHEGAARGPNDVLLRAAIHGAKDSRALGLHITVPGVHGGVDEAHSALDAIEASSAFGTAPLHFAEPLPLLLEGAAIAAFRAYDLPRGMRLLRARSYVRTEPSPGLAAGLGFVRSAQCDDGSFGDYDTALAQMAALGERNAVLRLKTPVTMQALWTISELESPYFRLVDAALAPLRLARC